MMKSWSDRLREWIGSRLGIYRRGGFTVVVDNQRADIATPDVLDRLDEALGLVERYQPWRIAHLRRDLKQIRVMRYPCRGAYFPAYRACMVELTFLSRRDIGAATVASTIVHEGMHARIHALRSRTLRAADPSDSGVSASDHSREERICRRAELEFGQSLPESIGAPVIARAVESLALADEDVAPDIDWQEALRRQSAIDAGA